MLTRYAVGVAVVCALATACSDSKYQSFRDTDMDAWVDVRQQWKFPLPFKSGERLGILRMAPDDVLVFDPGKTLHVMRISRGPGGRETIAAAELDCAREVGGIYGITHETAPLELLGISPDANASWKLKWEEYLGDDGSGYEVLEDPSRGVYVPRSDGGGRFSMRGFATVDGRSLPPFPANFRLTIGKGGKVTGVRLAGTAVDFERRALYIHDRKANSIVCAALR